MHKFRQIWRWYVRGGLPENATISQMRKLQFVNICALLGFMVCLPFGFSDLSKYYFVGLIELTAGVTYILAGLTLRLWKKSRLATNLIILATFLLVVMLTMTGGGDGAGIVWVLVFPTLIFFLEDWLASVIWVAVLLVVLAVLFFSHNFYSGYDKIMYEHVSYAIVTISLIVFFYQQMNRQAERINERAKHDLSEGNQKLQQLNSALAAAKADVEQQVVERTRSLVKEHARLEASVGSLPLGLILTDHNFFISSINSEAKKILGAGQKQAIETKDYADILRHELRLGSLVDKAMTQKRRFDLPEKIYHDRFIQITAAPIILPDATEAIGAIILAEDVTEKKIVARARDEFFLVASHELRTPLTIVEGNISIIKEHFLAELKNSELNHMIENAYDSTQRLIYIVNQLLQVSAIELGEVKLNLRAVNLYDLCESSLQKYQAAAKAKKIDLKIEAGNEVAEAEADSEQLDHILSGLIDNAVRNTDSGEVKLVVSREPSHAQIEIRDTGRGISDANQALLFHKFHQSGSDVMTRDSAQSIGLGLYLAKLLTEKMAGKIYLKDSVAGKGSTFVLELPLATRSN